MRASFGRRLAALFLVTLALACAASAAKKEPLPWAFRGEPGKGYQIDFVSVDPEPGTPLEAGAHAAVHVSLKYSLSIAEHGDIMMVFEDEHDHGLKGVALSVQPISRGDGELTISGELTVPMGIKELHVFVPIVPDGAKHTSGELTIRYPVGPATAK
jgi:hypothetical protein